MTSFNLKRRGTCSVCPVLWEEGHREMPPYPDYGVIDIAPYIHTMYV